MPDPSDTPAADNAPYFFLSHSHVGSPWSGGGGPDNEIGELHRLMCHHVRHLTALPPEIDPGFLDERMGLGTPWNARLRRALATCRVFVPLYSPRYFTRAWCGSEWAAFLRREAAYAAQLPAAHRYAFSAIVPVIWAPVDHAELPPCAAGRQYRDIRLGESYLNHGLYALRTENEPDYRRAVLRITQTVIRVAAATRLPPCDPTLFDESRNAFLEPG